MVVGPHPLTITLYSTDNTTLKSGSRVYVVNTTKRTESSEELTNSSGIAIIDLANLPDPVSGNKYDAGDKILIIAYDGNDSDAYLYTVTGQSYSKTLYLNPLRHSKNETIEKILTLVLANTTATVYYARVYNKDGRLLLHAECPANNSMVVPYKRGISCKNGAFVERENYGLLVTAEFK